MEFDFKKARVDCHNYFPSRVLFKTEKQFHNIIEINKDQLPFIPIKIGYNEDKTFQTCMGHLGDGLEFLPYRPDYMFDHCFKVIDEAGKKLFPNKGIKGIVQGLGDELLNIPSTGWPEIIELLSSNMPVLTSRFIVKKIFESEEIRQINPNDNDAKLATRAKKCFSTDQYDEFIKKFVCDSHGKFSTNLAVDREIQLKAAKFLLMLLKGHRGSKQKDPKYPLLDLSKDNNHFPESKKCEFIASVLLFHVRNERAHGSTLSPFRTSKSNISKYEGYYYSMLCAYILALGIFQLSNFGGFSSEEIKTCTQENIRIQKILFNFKYRKLECVKV